MLCLNKMKMTHYNLQKKPSWLRVFKRYVVFQYVAGFSSGGWCDAQKKFFRLKDATRYVANTHDEDKASQIVDVWTGEVILWTVKNRVFDYSINKWIDSGL